MNFLDSFVLGIIEGVTEFLPISSTGHLILTSHLLKIPQTEFLKTFEIAIQLGAILAVVFLYFKTLTQNLNLTKKILVAFIPTAVIGLSFYKFIKNYLLDNEIVVLISLFLGGMVLIVFEKFHQEKNNAIHSLTDISYKQSFIIGLFQSVAIIPGISRAAATIVGGLTQSISRKTIVEFSFLLAIPTMLAASGLDLLKTAGDFSKNEFLLLLAGFATSFVIAILAIKFLLKFIQNHTFIAFGIYRVALAAIFWFLI